jgi:hypothetical protein
LAEGIEASVVTKVAGNVELTATAAGIVLGGSLAVYPIEHHAGFILALLAGLLLVLAVYLRYHHTEGS